MDIRNLINTLETINTPEVVSEAKGHLDHPEDLVFLDDVPGVKRALDAIVQTVENPKTVTIKWDGYPALIFGRDEEGRFSIMDKHMFNKKDGTGRRVFSPKDFREYDAARGVDRNELYQIIDDVWAGLEKADQSKGYYWGDLLFREPLKDENGVYRFRANPKGITYTVDVDSDVGKLLTDKKGAIAVHQFIPAGASDTGDAKSLDGSMGSLKNNSDVAIVPSKMPITPNISINQELLNKAKSDASKYGPAIEKLMTEAPQARNSFNQLFTTYVNKKIVSGDLSNLVGDFVEYVENRPMTDRMREKITKHLADNKEGIQGAFQVWIDIYNLKMDVVKQLDKAAETSPVKGFLDDGKETHEGFVANGLKFVDRMGFSRQNLGA